jgi:UDP-sulfoquinovose synthase
MRVLILGGDGYLGWPMAMNLSKAGYQVRIVDNYLRRKLHKQTGMTPLLQAPNLIDRCNDWQKLTARTIEPVIGDLTDHEFTFSLLRDFRPETVIHFAEQPSAPFSMKDTASASLTLSNNITVTANLLLGLKEICPSTHLIKLGTMGEYGTPNIDIEEGWLEITHNGRKDKFLYPRQAGSLYHTTKIMDTDLIWFYVRSANLRVTDLMQGPVYGVFTDDTIGNDRLLPHFSYDEIFGTVLNRFFCQAVIDHPLTVYGSGQQTRGYLDIRDTIASIRIVIDNPPSSGKLVILNQFVETFSVNQLAEKVTRVALTLGLRPSIKTIPNPRIEAEDHYYNPKNSSLISLGLQPHYLTDDFIQEALKWLITHRSKIDPSLFLQGIHW